MHPRVHRVRLFWIRAARGCAIMREGPMSPEELARAWVETFNTGDFAANKDLGAEDGWFGITAPNAGTDREAGDQVARGWKAAFPDAKGEITRVVVNGNDVAMELEWV